MSAEDAVEIFDKLKNPTFFVTVAYAAPVCYSLYMARDCHDRPTLRAAIDKPTFRVVPWDFLDFPWHFVFLKKSAC